MLRNGYARPSLAADSADRMSLRFSGTCLRANLPPNTAAIGQYNQRDYGGDTVVNETICTVGLHAVIQ